MSLKTQEFLQVLRDNPDKTLYFEYRPGAFVRSDVHLTEVKNVHFDTVDCGGLRNEWQEVHVQLWENEDPEPDHAVNTSKALEILEAVHRVRPILQDAVIKFEYGNSGFPTAVLPIHTLQVENNHLLLRLIPDQTTCKAKDRATSPEEKAAACCGPAGPKPKIRLSLQNLASSPTCEPNSGCC
ncbi:hypothetical protein A3SI_07384 [Nitritalea halalkaliphila LW7]|uniref:Uncharacterized protein n=1 Tax=Nitritalea halalkaliphila LW7 TaxID=1189621 RepID=I5C5K4_9BACT|nr:DUF6428 family protein [Nitritalea halalkaliphila]EIM77106.1 hypothetical protein A3SI_07384 [Nitritalea halalkaliphila LW7]